jgi:hypothetical protein
VEGAGRGQNNSLTLAIFDPFLTPKKVEARGNDGMNFRRSVVVWLSDIYVKTLIRKSFISTLKNFFIL